MDERILLAALEAKRETIREVLGHLKAASLASNGHPTVLGAEWEFEDLSSCYTGVIKDLERTLAFGVLGLISDEVNPFEGEPEDTPES